MSLPLDPREAFLARIATYHPLLPTTKDYLYEHARTRAYSKKESLLPLGEINSHLHYVYTGLVRGYHITENEPGMEEKSTSSFAAESSFVISLPSFSKQVPSLEGFEVLEESVLVSLSYQDLQVLYETDPAARIISRMILEDYMQFLEERVRVLKSPTGKKKYGWFQEYHPELKGRVQENQIASYLGMTAVSLSRIRQHRV